MIGWLRRFLGRGEPQPAPPDAPLPAPSDVPLPAPPSRHPRTEDEVSAVEAALADLIAAGLRLGAHYDDLSRREVARRMAEHPEFAAGDWDEDLTARPPDALAIDILWSYRSLADGIEDEFANATLFSDHCYDGAEPADYEDLFRRLVALAGAWTCRRVTASPVPDLGPYGHGFRVAFEAEPPIPPVTFPADKDFDWALLAPLNGSLPPAETRRLRVVADGGTALVLFLTDEETRQVETCLGFGHGAFDAPA